MLTIYLCEYMENEGKNNLMDRRLTAKKNTIWIAAAIVFVFTILGVLLTYNEIYVDDIIIESMADGSLGAANRSIYSIRTDFIVMGLLWLLSLTGVRLFWFHVIQVLVYALAMFAACYLIKDNVGGLLRIILWIGICILFIPVYFSLIQFTIPAVVGSVIGGLLLIKGQQDRSRREILAGGILSLISFSIRIDSIYYFIAFIGPLCLIDFIETLCSHKKANACQRYKKAFTKFLPVILVLALMLVLTCIDTFVIPKLSGNGDFNKWNEYRANVDDYKKPNYVEYEEEYNSLGLKAEDYELLLTWNNLDENVFDYDTYSGLNELVSEYKDASSRASLGIVLKTAYEVYSGTAYTYFIIFIAILAIITQNIIGRIKIFAALFVNLFLSIVFVWIDRMTSGIEFPLQLVTMIILLSLIDFSYFKKKLFLWMIALVLIGMLYLNPITDSPIDEEYSISIMGYYYVMATDPLNYYRCICNLVQGKEEYHDEQTSDEISEYFFKHKENLYYTLWHDADWKSPYPLVARDVFRMYDIGGSENVALLGQYPALFKSYKTIEKNYGITDRFSGLYNDNVFLVIKTKEYEKISETMVNYLKLHYFGDTVIEVVEYVDDAAIAKIMRTR